jgi:hypothetical protein
VGAIKPLAISSLRCENPTSSKLSFHNITYWFRRARLLEESNFGIQAKSLLKRVSDPAKLPVLTRSADRKSISYGDSYGSGGGPERFFNKLPKVLILLIRVGNVWQFGCHSDAISFP